ncbi:hypothetical protein TNCV_1064321 [Trichonephila clavipes]|nr:hypothetical protein TNCV_1064321 [Trichonephila clavipes]
MEYHIESVETLGNNALPYGAVARSYCWGVVPMSFCLRKPDKDVDKTPLFLHSVARGVCRNACDGHRNSTLSLV